MRRRRFIHGGIAAIGALSIAGCTGTDAQGDTPQTYDPPVQSAWIPVERRAPDSTGVYFTHTDWEAADELDESDDPTDDNAFEEVVESFPIAGLPLYSAYLAPLAMVGILFYPFTEDLLPDEGPGIEGVDTSEMTWVGDTLVFHGSYSPDVFAEHYTDDFEAADERDGFTVYVGEGFSEGMAYAVSDDTLVVGMEPGEDEDYLPEEVVTAALNRHLEGTDRMINEEDGEWLFETTGEAQLALGAWETDDLGEALIPDDEAEDSVEEDSDVEDNPIFDDVDSLVNTLVYDVEDGEMQNIEARFSAIYPDDAPTEEEVEEHLIGQEDPPHEIHTDGVRIHATVTFEENPT